MCIIDTVSRAAAAAALILLGACGGSDPSVGTQDITFAIALDPQPVLAQGGHSAAPARVVDEDLADSSDEREPFTAGVALRMVDPMPPGIDADFAPGTLHVGDAGSFDVRASADAQPGQYQLVVAGTIAGGSSTTRYAAQVVQVEGQCAAVNDDEIREVVPSRMGRTIALAASGDVYVWGHNANADPQGPELAPPVPRTLAYYTAQRVAEVSPARSAASGRGVSAFVISGGGTLRLLTSNHRSNVGAPGGRAGWFVFDVPDMTGFVQVVVQEPTFFALRNDGTVWQFVSFVDGDEFHFSPATQVRGFADVAQLAAGLHHLLALRSDGTVLAAGSNAHGQLGDGSGEPAQDPIVVPGLTDITRIAAGDEHSLALRREGTVLAWGRGDSGQIGDGFQVDAPHPLQVVNANGNTLTAMIDVAAGSAHSVLFRADGTVLTWGRGSEGQLGREVDQASTPAPVDARLASRVFAAANATLQIDMSFAGAVFGWGDNAEGELGDGTAQRRRTAVAALGIGRGAAHCSSTATPGR